MIIVVSKENSFKISNSGFRKKYLSDQDLSTRSRYQFNNGDLREIELLTLCQANGGEVLPIEKHADIRIVDHARKEALPGTYAAYSVHARWFLADVKRPATHIPLLRSQYAMEFSKNSRIIEWAQPKAQSGLLVQSCSPQKVPAISLQTVMIRFCGNGFGNIPRREAGRMETRSIKSLKQRYDEFIRTFP